MKLIYTFLLLALLPSCKNETKISLGSRITKDPTEIKHGEKLFETNCSGCHNFNQEGIGPNLNGLTKKVSTNWIKKFIVDPDKMLDEKDSRTTALLEKYQVLMPSFKTLNEAELDALLGYMHTFTSTTEENFDRLLSLKHPIADSLPFSDIIADFDFVAQIPASSEKTPLARINKMECMKSNGRMFINDLAGILYELDGENIRPYLSLKALEKDFIDKPGLGTGFGSFAFHPHFDKNGLLYTTHAELRASKKTDFALPDSLKPKLQWVVKEWKTERPSAKKFSGKGRELLRIDFESVLHGMQEIIFNPTIDETEPDFGMLYIGLGDGGLPLRGFTDFAYHNGTKIWTSILRIDPLGNNSSNGMYGIPADNPFVNQKGKIKEVWAYGFRNPNRLTWDTNGNLFSSDIGHSHIEEINLVSPGKFYGWPIREGTFLINPYDDLGYVYPLPENDADYNVTYPVLQYDHSEGAAISGGFFSTKNEAKENRYLFGDIPTGQLYLGSISPSGIIEKLKVSLHKKVTNFKKITKNERVDLRLGQDCNGNIYVFTKADGKIYRANNF